MTTEHKQASTLTVERILAAALEIFCEKGYDGASIREIMTRAKVTQPVIYYHFGSKRELYKAVLEQCMDMFFDSLQEALRDEDSPLNRLRIIVRMHFQFQRIHRSRSKFIYSAFFGLPRVVESKRILERGFHIMREVCHEIECLQKDGLIAEGNSEMMAVSLMGAFNMHKMRNLLDDDFPLTDEHADLILINFLNGVSSSDEMNTTNNLAHLLSKENENDRAVGPYDLND